MDADEFESRKVKLFEYAIKAGTDKEEVEKYLQKEYYVSIDLGMNEEDSRTRSLISTINYYRKYFDKIGNRAKFCCLGISQPTDYGLTKKVKDVKKRWMDPNITTAEKEDMIHKKVISDRGIPLHTSETTLIEDKFGKPINPDDEMSQNVVGVIEDKDGKRFPAIIKVYGKKGCEDKKPMFTWGTISGEQSNSKMYPGYIILNTREPAMTTPKGASRINLVEYKTLVETNFKDLIVDMDDTEAALIRLENMKGHVFLKNGRILDYSYNTYGTSSSLRTAKSAFDIEAPTIADLKIPNHVELDVDPATKEEVWMMVLPRAQKVQDKLITLDVLSLFVENPMDKDKFKMKKNFMGEEEDTKLITSQMGFTSTSNEGDSLRSLMEKRNNLG
jgi:hypothetical protein